MEEIQELFVQYGYPKITESELKLIPAIKNYILKEIIGANEKHINACANDMLHKNAFCWCGANGANQLKKIQRAKLK